METPETLARDFLLKNAPHIQLQTWGGNVTNKSSFIDTRTDKEFTQPFKEVRRVINRNKDAMFGKTTRNTPESYNEKLTALCDHIQVVTYGKTRSKFIDTRRNIEFEEDNKQVLHRLKNPNHLFAPTKEEVVNKRGDSIEAKYGVRHALQSPDLLIKARDTLEQNHGVRSPLHSSAIQEKVTSTHLEKYGETRASKTVETKLKFKETCMEKFGGVAPMQNEVVRDKSRETCISKYGHTTYNASMEARIKSSKYLIDDLPLTVFAETSKYALSYLHYLARNNIDLTNINEKGTSIEKIIVSYLDSKNISYVQDRMLANTKYRPDFLIEDHKLIIECEGNYWHSDAQNKNNSFHVEKKDTYNNQGYVLLSFRESEIIQKFEIVSMLIDFFTADTSLVIKEPLNYHYSSNLTDYSLKLAKDSSVDCLVMSYKSQDVLMLFYSINGQELSITSILPCTPLDELTFLFVLDFGINILAKDIYRVFITLDHRFESFILPEGFSEVSKAHSFVWTKGLTVCHASDFPGNTGYDHGYHKLWDCGQTKFAKEIK